MRGPYITQGHAELLAGRLSNRDRAILLDLARVRVLSGKQLDRLHFADLAPGSRERTRRRVMARLVEHRLVSTLERTVGGARSGSAGYVFSLDVAAQRVLALVGGAEYIGLPSGRTRAPETPGTLFLAHALDVSGLFVALKERERAGDLTLAQYAVESAAWHPDEQGGVLKPDAYVRIRRGEIEDSWWVEVDRATESLPTLKRKLRTYVDFATQGGCGPDGVMPRVLVTVPHGHRLAGVRAVIDDLPAPASELIISSLYDQAVPLMIDTLRA